MPPAWLGALEDGSSRGRTRHKKIKTDASRRLSGKFLLLLLCA
jgi:hypothetical protein